jgi:predicted nucleic acid-binding protein
VGTVVLDASVVIGHLDARDVHHQAARAALERHEADDLLLPASAYAEALVGPVRRGETERARSGIGELGLTIAPIDEEAAEAAATLRGRFPSLRLPDALVLGHAEAIDADAVLTTDAWWSRVSPRVRPVA